MTTLRSSVCFLVLYLITAAARADDWPQWRGANREGIWREEGIVESFPAKGLPVRWRAPVGAGFSGPAVAAGRVYLTDRMLDDSAQADVKSQYNYRDKTHGWERVVCLDEATGKPIWTHKYPCAYSVAYGSGPRATPTVEGGKVYTLGRWAISSVSMRPMARSSGRRISSATTPRMCPTTVTPALRWSSAIS